MGKEKPFYLKNTKVNYEKNYSLLTLFPLKNKTVSLQKIKEKNEVFGIHAQVYEQIFLG